MEGLLTYEDGMTNIDATISALPIVAGVFALEMDGFTLNTLAMENVNFNLMKLMMVGGASYRDGVVYLSKSQIRNTETGKKSNIFKYQFFTRKNNFCVQNFRSNFLGKFSIKICDEICL